METKVTDNKRNSTIDILRFVTVFWVAGVTHLLYYAQIHVADFHPSLSFLTKMMMTALVFISGFLNGKKSFTDIKSVGLYYKKRFLHTHVPLIIASLLMYGVYLITQVWLFKNMKCFILTLFGLSGIIRPAPGTLWFILMMLVFYLLTPLFPYPRKTSLILLKSAIVYAILIAVHYRFKLLDERIIMYFPSYILGLLLTGIKLSKRRSMIILSVSIAVTAVSAFYIAGLTENIHINSVLLPFTVPVILAFSELLSRIPRLNKVLAYLGSISMSVYLFHRHVYILLHYYLGSDFSVPFAYLVALPLCIITAVIINRLLSLLTRPSDFFLRNHQ